MNITVAGATDIGRKRKMNQDSFRLELAHNLYVVADGMGGHAAGDMVSKITVETISETVNSDRVSKLGTPPADLIMGAIHRANTAVFNTAQNDKKLQGMGTTCVTMLFDAGKIFIGHVGDSRVYLLQAGQPGKIWQVTRDHSMVNEKLRAGLITREQMKQDKNKNVITRSVGFESSVLVDSYQRDVVSGEIYLACSDGLSGLVDDAHILAIVNEYGDLDLAAQKLIAMANENGGDDNITVVLARVD